MHLTNYSVNKHSESFDHDKDFDKGSKRFARVLCDIVWLLSILS